MKYRIVLLAALASFVPPAIGAGVPDLSAQEIMEKNFFASKLQSLSAYSWMTLINQRGQKRERRSFNIVKLQPNGIDSNVLVRFESPADIKGTAFLQLEHADGEDDQWIYLPALKKSRRLVANNKKDSFVGSDFSYGDLLLPKVEQYRHTVLRSEVLDGHACHVIESVPADDRVRSNSGYSKKITWVRTDNFLESKVEYYDLSGRLLKTQLVSGHELMEPDRQRWFARAREMTNHQTQHKTVLRFENLRPGVAVPDEQFSLRYLERE